MKISSVHLNGNLICAIDIETTGLIPGVHDILQIAIVPLGPDLKLSKNHKVFHMKLQPKRPDKADEEALKVNKVKIVDALMYGTEAWSAVDRLGEWFIRLNLPEKKKIVPLGFNYGGIDKAFITEWLGGPLSYDAYFRSDHRDAMTAALFMNDQAELLSEPIPFPKYSLAYVSNILGVEHERSHDAVGDCLATAECYRRIMTYRQFHKMFLPAGTDLGIQYRGDHTLVTHDSNEVKLDRDNPNLCLRVSKSAVVSSAIQVGAKL